jgi:hypothetical protein
MSSKKRDAVFVATGNARVGIQTTGHVVITGGIHLGALADDDDFMPFQVGGLTLSPADNAEGDDQ